MPAWDRVYATTPAAGAALGGTTETVALTSPGVNLPQPNATVLITAHLLLTSGSTVTSIVVRVRRNSLTGTQVYTSGLVVFAATTIGSYDLEVVDNPPDSASLPYVVTVVQTGAGSNGTWNVGSTICAYVFT
jgi:hypothetical protein